MSAFQMRNDNCVEHVVKIPDVHGYHYPVIIDINILMLMFISIQYLLISIFNVDVHQFAMMIDINSLMYMDFSVSSHVSCNFLNSYNQYTICAKLGLILSR